MIGPAGFMRAPNTYEGRPRERGPLKDWETIRLGDVWSSVAKDRTLRIEEPPHNNSDIVICTNLASKRRVKIQVPLLIRDYRLIMSKKLTPGPASPA